MKLTITKRVDVKEEIEITLPYYANFSDMYVEVTDFDFHIKLVSVTHNCISSTVMTKEQFEAWYSFYGSLYELNTEEEFNEKRNKLPYFLLSNNKR